MDEQKIYDIYELEKVSFFPLALGYWLLIIVISIAILSVYFYKKYQNKKYNSWQWKAKKDLQYLMENQYINVIQLHNVIKKIIINSHNRSDTANITDIGLLEFLQENDPNKFDWLANGEILQSIFSPNKTIRNSEDTKQLILAIKKWI